MPSKSKLLSLSQSEEFNSELIELLNSDLSLTERLIRCRQIIENLYKAITVSTNITFTGLYARMQYVHEVYAIPAKLVEQLQLLRLLTNKVVHKDDFNFTENDFVSAVKILSEALDIFSGKNCPEEIVAFLLHNKAQYLSATWTTFEQTIDHIFGMVTDWKCSSEDTSRRYIEIKCQLPDGSSILTTLWDKKETQPPCQNWLFLDKVLWKYCNISFYNLSLVKGMTNRYQSTPHTIVVLEQDFLVDVSSVADCFQGKECYPELFFINKLFTEPITPALAKGKLVNHIFDELIVEPSKDIKVIYTQYLQNNPQQVFSLGLDAWQDIYNQIFSDHYPQLRDIASKLNKKNCQLEPSFISIKFGLHGRLDVITLPHKNTAKYSIIELKSGTAPSRDIWKAHQMQVVGYNLILKEIFGPANLANSSIFYSKSSEAPLRHVVNHITLEQEFMMCRNRIIGLLQKLATNPDMIVNWLKTNPRNYPNQFLNDKAKHVRSTLQNLSETETSWLINKLRFIFREIWAVKTGAFVETETGNYGFSSLWNCSLAEKKSQYRIIDNLWIESIDEDKITLHRQDENTLSNLRIGDIIVLYRQNVPVNEQQLIRGTIDCLDNEKIIIRTRCNLKKNDILDNYSLWAIEPDLMESSLYNGLYSIYSLLSSDKQVRAKLLGKKAPEFIKQIENKALSWRKDITESLQGMIAAKDYYLIQGPPGTGKTSCLLLQYVQHILAETDNKMLILSFTNRAVDEICLHLDKEQVNYIRIGAHKQITNSNSGKKPVFINPEALYLSNRIFTGTLHSFLAAAPDLLKKITFDELILDEASQILEQHVIGLMSKIPKTILIGDQFQLPPIILQKTETEKSSILEKLITNADKKIFPTCYSMLTYHYRMHKDIARLVSDNYQNKLATNSKRQLIQQPWIKTNDPLLEKVFNSRIVWIDTQPSYQSKADDVQAEWIKKLLDRLSSVLHQDEICTKIGIISPFRAQAQCIISALGNKYSDLTVDTVERYQGSERDCIIMSYPIRYHYEISMLQSVNIQGTVDRKLNVALSRAREQLIILGSSKILTHSEFFHKTYSLIKEHGLLISIDDISAN